MLGETVDFRPARRIAGFTRARILGLEPMDRGKATVAIACRKNPAGPDRQTWCEMRPPR